MAVDHGQTEMGRISARFVADPTGGKGEVLFDRGIAGTFGDEVSSEGGMEIFAEDPGIELVQVDGDWTRARPGR